MTQNSLILWRAIPQPAIAPNFHLELLECRYLLSAQLDPTFGDDGHVFAPRPEPGTYVFFTVQPDGRILLASSTLQGAYTGEYRTMFQRLLPDGVEDNPASSAIDNPIPLPPAANVTFPPLWSEKPIFQDTTDDLDWSQLEQPWD